MKFPVLNPADAPSASLRRVPPRERGIALVITLLLLAVITFMTVTFLVVSRSEQGNVATQTDQTVAQNAADAALQRAQIELIVPMIASTNPYVYPHLISTNYINRAGFDPGAVNSLTNVNYDAKINGTPLSAAESRQNIANLLYNPRPPVFVVTNGTGLFAQSNEFRFYRDDNRNQRFEATGLEPVISSDPARPYINSTDGSTMTRPAAGVTLSNYVIGDPQWIGILERPQFAHSSSNQFVARYAYEVVPVGLTLDINTMHNYTKFPSSSDMGTTDGFFRNQGVLTSEINLAAFLGDLNTNMWPVGVPSPETPYAVYSYFADTVNANKGAAFDDAVGVLYYRYNRTPKSLANVTALYGAAGNNAFVNPFDVYSQGPLMTNTFWLSPVQNNPNPGYVSKPDPWSGSQSPNRFSSPQDFLDVNKTAFNQPAASRSTLPSLATRLQQAGTNVSTYDRYTFSRLLSQLGTDSNPDPGGKMNINYMNVDQYGRVVPGMVTNFQSWPAAQFFTNAAIRLLADAGYSVGSPLGATNVLVTNVVSGILVTNLRIPIYPTNFYTPSVHRLLQLAANIFDSTTNRMELSVPAAPLPLPTLFRPLFTDMGAGNPLFITDYREVTAGDAVILTNSVLANFPKDPAIAANRPVLASEMVYGIPLVIGAKKGLPNFNKYVATTLVQVTRKLQFHRAVPGGPLTETNQMFLVGITNTFGVEGWNSYAAKLGRPMEIMVFPDITVSLSNRVTGNLIVNNPRYVSPSGLAMNAWEGFNNTQVNDPSFKVAASNSVVFQATASYSKQNDRFIYPVSTTFEPNMGFYLPQWAFSMRTRLRYALVDTTSKKIVDYVILSDVVTNLDVSYLLQTGGTCSSTVDSSAGGVWCTNRYPSGTSVASPTWGVYNQLQVGLGLAPADDNVFVRDFPTASATPGAAVNFFRAQFNLSPLGSGPPGPYSLSNTFNAPYQPYRKIYICNYWQANDPLVHYTSSDLSDLVHTNFQMDSLSPDPTNMLGRLNSRYEPWGQSASSQVGAPIGKYDIATKDPVAGTAGSSDSWDFVTNKFPNPGWLGRVHRGTPWQTAYFKSPVVTTASGIPQPTTNGVPLAAWQRWTGDNQIFTNFGQISTSLVPLYDPTVAVPSGSYPPSAYADSFLSQPTNDWRLLDLFSTAFSDTATKGQLSVNQSGLAAWSAVLSGTVALTNTFDAGGNPMLSPVVIQPAGYYNPADTNTWSPIVRIVDAINQARAAKPGQVFTHMGDILSVPALTIASPYLNTTIPPDMSQGVQSVLNDAAFERIPQQILGLLKVEAAPRFVIYAWGQTLKPAPRSVYSGGGQFFGLVTNYQIMAEVATRTVVRIDGATAYQNGRPTAITNLHPVIESYTVLRPE